MARQTRRTDKVFVRDASELAFGPSEDDPKRLVRQLGEIMKRHGDNDYAKVVKMDRFWRIVGKLNGTQRQAAQRR